MIYDEGMSVESARYSFFAFQKFAVSNPKATLKTGYFPSNIRGKKVFRSYCGQTEVGWYFDKQSKEWGCYEGKREESPEQFSYHLSLLQADSQAEIESAEAAAAVAESKTESAVVEERKMDHERTVRMINQQQSQWEAKVYSDEFIQKRIAQLKQKSRQGVDASFKRRSAAEADVAAAESRAVALASDTDSKDDADALPKEFSWANHEGKAWIEPNLDQQDCGSCYAVAGIHMLSSRYKVLKGDPKAEGFSINFPLYCADLNQGCNGGFPSLVSMWSKHVGLVPKKCTGAYYTSSTDSCQDMLKKNSGFRKCVEDNEQHLGRVSNWNYVGGYYGASTAQKMMADLYQHGALAVALEPESDFMYYSKGVYRHTSAKTNVPWVRVDHAVLLIGWGEEDVADEHDKTKMVSTPFWTIQNSWGSEWGENGNIRVIRGENESGIEFQAVAAYLEDGSKEAVLDYVDSLALGHTKKAEL